MACQQKTASAEHYQIAGLGDAGRPDVLNRWSSEKESGMETQAHTDVIHIFVKHGHHEKTLEFKTDTATGLEIKTRADVSAKDGLYLVKDGKHIEVGDAEVVTLHDGMRFELILIHIFVKRAQQELRLEFGTPTATGLEIKLKAGGSAQDGLYFMKHGERHEVEDGEVVHLHDGEHFVLVLNGRVS